MKLKKFFKKKSKSSDEFGFTYDFLERTDLYSLDEKTEKKKNRIFAWNKKPKKKENQINENQYSFAEYLNTIEDVQNKKITSLTLTEKVIIIITLILIIYLMLSLKGLVPIF